MVIAAENPLLEPWDANLGLPPFDSIRPEHFSPAFAQVMAEHLAAIDAVTAAPSITFDNTVRAIETAKLPLDRITAAFFHLAGVASDEQIQAIERDISPKLARHTN